MFELTRRNLLKYFGIGIGTLVIPPAIEKAAKAAYPGTFQFKDFENWLQTTSRAIQEKKLVSFRILADKELLHVSGNADAFISNFEEYKNKYENEDPYKMWGHDEAPGEIADNMTSNHVSFNIGTDKIPSRFLETIKTKHGRLNFVKMCNSGTLNKMKDVGTYLAKCEEECTKETKDRFLPNMQGDDGDPECICYKPSTLEPNCPYHSTPKERLARARSEILSKELRKRGTMNHEELIKFSKEQGWS